MAHLQRPELVVPGRTTRLWCCASVTRDCIACLRLASSNWNRAVLKGAVERRTTAELKSRTSSIRAASHRIASMSGRRKGNASASKKIDDASELDLERMVIRFLTPVVFIVALNELDVRWPMTLGWRPTH